MTCALMARPGEKNEDGEITILERFRLVCQASLVSLTASVGDARNIVTLPATTPPCVPEELFQNSVDRIHHG